MGKYELEKRGNWQTKSGKKALRLEQIFKYTFNNEFKNNQVYSIREKPTEFKSIYENVQLSKKTQREIYNPEHKYRHGISIDFAIDNLFTKKTLYVEVKRQDGWIESLPPSAGRGNAHERLCKLFTPGLLDILRKKSMINSQFLPFWIVFGGNITRDPKRVREITCWFKDFENHFYMWRDLNNTKGIINHFNLYLKKLLQ